MVNGRSVLIRPDEYGIGTQKLEKKRQERGQIYFIK